MPYGRGKKFIDYSDIVIIESDSYYSKITTNSFSYFFYVYDSLLELENNLPYSFFKCNRSQIVNLKFVTEYNILANKLFITIKNLKVKISQNKKNKFLSTIENYQKEDSRCYNCIFMKNI
jgi:DNA-binding LytR/AlgR family response regulator